MQECLRIVFDEFETARAKEGELLTTVDGRQLFCRCQPAVYVADAPEQQQVTGTKGGCCTRCLVKDVSQHRKAYPKTSVMIRRAWKRIAENTAKIASNNILAADKARLRLEIRRLRDAAQIPPDLTGEPLFLSHRIHELSAIFEKVSYKELRT